jgi:hypothetical protein
MGSKTGRSAASRAQDAGPAGTSSKKRWVGAGHADVTQGKERLGRARCQRQAVNRRAAAAAVAVAVAVGVTAEAGAATETQTGTGSGGGDGGGGGGGGGGELL